MYIPDFTDKEAFKSFYKDQINIPFNYDGDFTIETQVDPDLEFMQNLYCIASHEPAYFGKKKQIKELLIDENQVRYFSLNIKTDILGMRLAVLKTDKGFLLLDGTHRLVSALAQNKLINLVVDIITPAKGEILEHHSMYI